MKGQLSVVGGGRRTAGIGPVADARRGPRGEIAHERRVCEPLPALPACSPLPPPGEVARGWRRSRTWRKSPKKNPRQWADGDASCLFNIASQPESNASTVCVSTVGRGRRGGRVGQAGGRRRLARPRAATGGRRRRTCEKKAENLKSETFCRDSTPFHPPPARTAPVSAAAFCRDSTLHRQIPPSILPLFCRCSAVQPTHLPNPA